MADGTEASDAGWLRAALEEADRAGSMGEVPVGAVVVGSDGVELGRGHNRREVDQDPTAHAEMIAIRAAAARAGTWRLEGATLYATLEPCVMCAGALVLARVARVVYGCDDPKGGALKTLYTLGEDARLNHRFTTTRGVLADESAEKLRAFFATLRSQGKK